jgi:SAM-dependent methyltransferase
MPNERGKNVDTSYLNLDLAEDRKLIHRDYLAHCLRWSHAVRSAVRSRDDLRVLDVGCGKDMPLAKALYVNKIGATRYCGVDYYGFSIPDTLKNNGVFPIRLVTGFDAADIDRDVVSFVPNFVTCFEMFEHVEPQHGRAILDAIYRTMDDEGLMLFSTPCFNGNPAGNHVAEPEYEVMGATLEDAGFCIEGVWGTFASMRDYCDLLTDEQYALFERLYEYYDANMLAVIFAPLFPERARNCLWRCRKTDKPYMRLFPPRLNVKPKFSPTGSSSLQDDILDEDMNRRMQDGIARRNNPVDRRDDPGSAESDGESTDCAYELAADVHQE